MTSIPDPIAHVASLDFRWGQLQAIRFDASKTDLFPEKYLIHLYDLTRASGRSRLGSLPMLFCGMTDLSCEAIVAYLRTLPLIVLGEWRPYEEPAGDGSRVLSTSFEFHPLGYCFLATLTSSRLSTDTDPHNFAFGAYTFFQEAWGSSRQLVLTYLGIAALFSMFRLRVLGGSRYTSNQLTARWMRRFGFRDLAELPSFLLDSATGDTVPATFSILERVTFARLLGGILAELE